MPLSVSLSAGCHFQFRYQLAARSSTLCNYYSNYKKKYVTSLEINCAIMVIKREVAYGIVQGLSDFWKCEELQDFTVTLGTTKFGCHRFLLAACSGFFRGLFRSGMKETELKYVNVEDISSETFEFILETLYTGRGVLTNDNVIDIWRAAHQLQITFLIRECENFVIKTLSFENYVDYFLTGRLLNSETVSQTVWSFILKNSNDFFRTHCFNELPLSDVLNVIRSQDLVVKSEHDVINAILRWVEFTSVKDHGGTNQNVQNMVEKRDETNTLKAVVDNHDDKCSDTCNNMAVSSQHEKEKELFTNNGNRRKYLFTLLSNARLCLTSQTCLEKLARHPLVCYSTKVKDLVIDALLYQLQTENKRSGQWPSGAIHRNNSPLVNVAIVPGRFGMTVNIRVFCFSTQTWFRLENKALDVVKFAGTESICYAFGTTSAETSKSSDKYSTPLKVSNSFSSQANDLFGQQSKGVTFGVFGQQCKDFTFGASAVTKDASSIEEDTQKVPITVFKYQDGSWSNLAFSLTLPSEMFSVVGANSFLYVLSNKQFWRLDPAMRTHVQMKNYPDDDPICHLTNYEEMILVFSSAPKKGIDETVIHCYDSTQNVWTRLNNLEGPADGMTSFKDNHFTYILQSSGDIWKMVKPQSDVVDFEHVGKLWSCDWPVQGAVTFMGELYIYGVKSEARKDDPHLRQCLPGVFRQIIYMESNSTELSTFLPIVLRRSDLKNFV
ncbi:kelch-like protein 40 [Biomphalaria pfeifferi]|uniref:Kelch-like protein 40 n=1 Tax=Biomphalaria pfeifferi TaxID=112525 RepID=A0AAD8B6H5_BIOPF|nr:kelch-like protein 40 [Biomphalaria pfeifferi]